MKMETQHILLKTSITPQFSVYLLLNFCLYSASIDRFSSPLSRLLQHHAVNKGLEEDYVCVCRCVWVFVHVAAHNLIPLGPAAAELPFPPHPSLEHGTHVSMCACSHTNPIIILT